MNEIFREYSWSILGIFFLVSITIIAISLRIIASRWKENTIICRLCLKKQDEEYEEKYGKKKI